MGQYFKIVNITKKEFIDIDELGENNKLSFVGKGLNGIALGRLLTSHGESDELWWKSNGNPLKDNIYIGAWAGNSIIISGDEDQADTNDFITSTIEERDLNLYYKVDRDNSFKNVTDEVIIWLTKDDSLNELFIERAKLDNSFLIKLLKLIPDNINSELKTSLNNICQNI